jgi:hypothetical protein
MHKEGIDKTSLILRRNVQVEEVILCSEYGSVFIVGCYSCGNHTVSFI